MELDTQYIKLSSKGELEIDRKLELGQDVDVRVVVNRIEKKDNEDGTYSLVYKCQLFSEA